MSAEGTPDNERIAFLPPAPAGHRFPRCCARRGAGRAGRRGRHRTAGLHPRRASGASPGQRPDPPLLPAQRLPRTPALPTGDRPWRRQPWRRPLHPPPTAHGRPPARGGTAQPLHAARRRRALLFRRWRHRHHPDSLDGSLVPGAGQGLAPTVCGPRTPARSLPRRTDDARWRTDAAALQRRRRPTRQYRADRRPRCRRRTLLLRTRRVDAGHPRRRERLRGTPALRTLRRSSSAGVLVRRHRRLPPGVAPQRPEPARRKPPEHPRSPRGTGPGASLRLPRRDMQDLRDTRLRRRAGALRPCAFRHRAGQRGNLADLRITLPRQLPGTRSLAPKNNHGDAS